MIHVRNEHRISSFTANDGCEIIELLHPKDLDYPLGFSLAIAEVAVGHSTYQHILDQDEVYYLLAGTGTVHIDTQSQALIPGDAVLIPRGCIQWVENTGSQPLKFAAVVSPPWTPTGDHRLDPDASD